MTNLSSLPGFGSGGSGASGDLPPLLTDNPVLVDSDFDYIRSSSYSQQSSSTYQSFHPLSNDGTFGGLFDPYNSSNNGGPYPVGFYVNPANGSLGSLQRGTPLYNSGGGAHFSTCHHGSVGMMVLNNGNHQNPSYGQSHKGWLYAAGFNNDGSIAASGNSQGPHEYAAHSNGDMAISANSATGTAYGRRSGYNSSTGTYYHNSFYFKHNGSSTGSQHDWNNPSSSTSTNYCTSAMKQSKDDLEPNGMIFWRDSSSQKILTPLYGSQCDRGTDYSADTYLGFTDNCQGFHLSDGTYLWFYNGKWAIQSSGTLSVPSYSPQGLGFLALLRNRDSQSHTCFPCQEDDTWIGAIDGNGLMKFKIHIDDNYRVEPLGVFNTFSWLYTNDISHSGINLALVGPNDEYLVYTKVKGAQASRYVYENPFAS